MKTHTLKPLHLFLPLILFTACTMQANEIQPFEWEVESPEAAGVDEGHLNALVQHIQDSSIYGVDGVILVRDGKMVFEEYFNGFTADSLHNVASVGKSITSALVGIAIEMGYIASKQEPVLPYFNADYAIDNLNPEKGEIQVQHLLTMSAGWDCDDWDEHSVGNTMHFPDVPDDFAFTLDLPMVKPNGERFSYCSGGANLLGEIIRRQSGMSLADFANQHLFHKIGVMDNEWFVTPKSQPYEFAGGGNTLKPRDLARFGLLYLNNGLWQGEQIIPKDWIAESTGKQIATPEDGDYGYFWWVGEYEYQNRVVQGYEASGNGGNKVVVIPELQVVIILTGSAYGSEYVEGEQARRIVEDYLLAAVDTNNMKA